MSHLISFAGTKKGSAAPSARAPTARGPVWITHLTSKKRRGDPLKVDASPAHLTLNDTNSVCVYIYAILEPRVALTESSGLGTKSPLTQSSSQSAALLKPLMGKRKSGKNFRMCFLYSSPGSRLSDKPAMQERLKELPTLVNCHCFFFCVQGLTCL